MPGKRVGLFHNHKKYYYFYYNYAKKYAWELSWENFMFTINNPGEAVAIITTRKLKR